MTAVARRGDDPHVFGARGRVRAAKLFPLPPSYTPGLQVLAGGREVDALYDALAELLARPDALDPDSETAGHIAEIEEKLAQHERQEADELRAAFEGSLRMPLDAGATLAKKIADVLDRHADPAADEPASETP